MVNAPPTHIAVLVNSRIQRVKTPRLALEPHRIRNKIVIFAWAHFYHMGINAEEPVEDSEVRHFILPGRFIN